MNWNEAYKLLKEGNKIKLPSWGGYWYWDNDKETIIMHTKDNEKIDIRETQRVDYTFSNIASDKWIIATSENTPILGGDVRFDFLEALKYLLRGFKVRRESWDLVDYIYFQDDSVSALLTGASSQEKEHVSYTITKDSILAKDWMFYEG